MVESTISHYKIVKKIGQGGMGEVYLAEDTRLQRKVAVKVLPAAAATNPEALARFERESQTAAALNHPNIATIYDVGSETRPDGTQINFIVEEFLDGQTLQELLKRGKLPLPKTLSFAVEIAQGLAAINAAGIVHRDLKPGNIFITSSGQLKILDFGLAKLTQPARTESSAENSPTLTISLTNMIAGQVIGTPGYMAPEQFGDAEVDQRADIFAFGTVLYEMLSGQHPFEGKTIHSTIHRILNEPPLPLDPMEFRLPPRVQWILEKCLQKNPEARYQHSSELLVDLRAAAANLSGSGGLGSSNTLSITGSVTRPIAGPLGGAGTGSFISRAPRSKLAGKYLSAILALAFFCGMGLSWLLKSIVQPKTQPAQLVEFDLPYRGQIRPWDGPAISPDGSMVVYRDSGTLWIRDLHSFSPRKLEGTEGAGQPFWSPHSDSIAYFTQNQLFKISKNGDTIIALCRLPLDLWGGGFWSSSGTILFGQGPGGIYDVDEQGGEPRQIVKPEKGENWLYWPSLLPDGKLMFVSLKQDNSSEIFAAESGRRTSIAKRSEFITWATYSRTGHLLYQLGSSTQRGIASFSIWALPFNAAKLAATGEQFQVASDGMAPTVSASGTLVYRTRAEKTNRLVWVDRQGKPLGTVGQSQATIRNPSISPDGQRVAAEGADTNSGFDIWIHEPRGTKERIAAESNTDRRHPVWSPTGDQIAFDEGGSVYVEPMDQSSEARKILPLGAVEEIFLNWSRTGRTLLYDFLSPNHSNRDIWYLRMPPTGNAMPLVQTPADEMLPQISPDERWVLYQSTESGGYLPDIYAVSFPDGKRKTKISISGGTHPRWSPTGDEIFYVDPDDSLVAVSVTADLKLGEPRRLFTSEEVGSDLSLDSLSYVYDVGAKGDRFVIVQMPTGGRIAVVQNWLEGFRGAK